MVVPGGVFVFRVFANTAPAYGHLSWDYGFGKQGARAYVGAVYHYYLNHRWNCRICSIGVFLSDCRRADYCVDGNDRTGCQGVTVFERVYIFGNHSGCANPVSVHPCCVCGGVFTGTLLYVCCRNLYRKDGSVRSARAYRVFFWYGNFASLWKVRKPDTRNHCYWCGSGVCFIHCFTYIFVEKSFI